MRKYRIVTIGVAIIAFTSAELQAQFSALFHRVRNTPVVHDGGLPNSSCFMPNCKTSSHIYGHYGVSWRKWPEPLSAYTTNPQLTPFVIPDQSGAPDTDVPDALDEAGFSPKRPAGSDAGTGAEELPSTTSPNVDSPLTEDLPAVDPGNDLGDGLEEDPLPEVPDAAFPTDEAFPSTDTSNDPLSSASDLDDVFGPDSSNSPDNSPLETPTTDDSDLLEDDFGGAFESDFGMREPRRFQRRSNDASEPAFDSRADREEPLEFNRPRLARASESDLSMSRSRSAERNERNPLRRNEVQQQPEAVAYAMHFDQPRRRPMSDRQFDDYRDNERYHHDRRRYDARQIDYRAGYDNRSRYDDRRDDYRYDERNDYRTQTRGRSRDYHSYDRAPRGGVRPSEPPVRKRSSNPLRP